MVNKTTSELLKELTDKEGKPERPMICWVSRVAGKTCECLQDRCAAWIHKAVPTEEEDGEEIVGLCSWVSAVTVFEALLTPCAQWVELLLSQAEVVDDAEYGEGEGPEDDEEEEEEEKKNG